MVSKNRYYVSSKISAAKFRQIIRLYALDLTASDTARLTGISVRSINNIYLKLGHRLGEICAQAAPDEALRRRIARKGLPQFAKPVNWQAKCESGRGQPFL